MDRDGGQVIACSPSTTTILVQIPKNKKGHFLIIIVTKIHALYPLTAFSKPAENNTKDCCQQVCLLLLL